MEISSVKANFVLKLAPSRGWFTWETKIEDTGRYETVYNLRVQDYDTYFVGAQDWGSACGHTTRTSPANRKNARRAGITHLPANVYRR
jgi:hypothetical protein